jgi:hypothetical protein
LVYFDHLHVLKLLLHGVSSVEWDHSVDEEDQDVDDRDDVIAAREAMA